MVVLASNVLSPPVGPVLIHLAVRDFTIIHQLDVELGTGLTVLTGETGAGKSILVDALGFALGGRASGDMVRPGARWAEVAAAFDDGGLPEIRELCDEIGADAGEDIIVRRRVSPEGRSRGWINDSPVSNRALRELGSQLVDLHGQHTHHALLRPAHQIRVLDAAACHDDLVARAGELFHRMGSLESELEAIRAVDGTDRSRRVEYLTHQCAELEALGALPGEAHELATELRRLSHAVEIRSGAEEIEDVLASGEHAAGSAVHRALSRLSDIENRVPGSTGGARELLETALVHVTEASAAVRALARDIDTDPGRLTAIEDRLGALHDAGRKHRVSADELPERLAVLRTELESLESSATRAREVERTLAAARNEYREAAERLSASRVSAAGRLSREVTANIRVLGLEGGEFSVEVNRSREERVNGIDEIVFMIRANPGHPPSPLARTASGGEQSRVSLGILVATRGGLPVMVFDEVDTGVGGRVAELVGLHLRRLSESCQVLCVTHLPQVASQAHAHLTVAKGANGSMTNVRVRTVEGEDRAREVARMLAGATITDRSLAHAREMLGSVRPEEKHA